MAALAAMKVFLQGADRQNALWINFQNFNLRHSPFCERLRERLLLR
jgi:hypothetical protein